HAPPSLPIRYVVASTSGIVSLLPSVRLIVRAVFSILTIVPRMSRPPPCASAIAANNAHAIAALMTLEKFLILLSLLLLVRTDRIHHSHHLDFLRCDFRQVADEEHELPVV